MKLLHFLLSANLKQKNPLRERFGIDRLKILGLLAVLYCEALGLIPRPLGRKLSLVLPSFSQKRPKYPVCLQRGFFYSGFETSD